MQDSDEGHYPSHFIFSETLCLDHIEVTDGFQLQMRSAGSLTWLMMAFLNVTTSDYSEMVNAPSTRISVAFTDKTSALKCKMHIYWQINWKENINRWKQPWKRMAGCHFNFFSPGNRIITTLIWLQVFPRSNITKRIWQSYLAFCVKLGPEKV